MSFEEFYKANYISLYRTAIGILHNEEDSRDIVADTFKKLWLVWDSADDPLALSKSMLRNACISHIRHLEVHERFKRISASDSQINESADICHEKRIELLRLYMATLDKEEMRLIQLVIYEKKTLKEVAKIIGCSYATVRRHFASLMCTLKDYISECEICEI